MVLKLNGDIMYLSVLQLENSETVSTGLRINKTMTIRAIRIGIYKHDTPDGTLTLTLKAGATTIGSAVVTMAALDADVGTFFHGYVRFDSPDAGWRVNLDNPDDYLEVTLEISLSSHTNDNSNYIALVKQPNLHRFVDSHGTIASESDISTEQLEHFQPFMVEVYKNS